MKKVGFVRPWQVRVVKLGRFVVFCVCSAVSCVTVSRRDCKSIKSMFLDYYRPNSSHDSDTQDAALLTRVRGTETVRLGVFRLKKKIEYSEETLRNLKELNGSRCILTAGLWALKSPLSASKLLGFGGKVGPGAPAREPPPPERAAFNPLCAVSQQKLLFNLILASRWLSATCLNVKKWRLYTQFQFLPYLRASSTGNNTRVTLCTHLKGGFHPKSIFQMSTDSDSSQGYWWEPGVSGSTGKYSYFIHFPN